MRRAISFILALVFCFSLACSVSATTNSPAQSGTPSTSTSTSTSVSTTVADNPKTGDTAHMELWVPMMVCSALALAAVPVVYSKKFKR